MNRMSDAPSSGDRSNGRRSRTPSADVGRELVSAAEAVLVRDGPGKLTVRAVAAEANIAPMGVYNRLGGKTGLVEALLVRGFDRLRAVVDSGTEPDMLARLRACGMRYREFALANPHFYAIMFEEAIPHEHESQEVGEHAAAAFGALVRNVELAAVAGQLAAPDPREAALQLWSAMHGFVALEMKGLISSPNPEMSYRALMETLLTGLSPGVADPVLPARAGVAPAAARTHRPSTQPDPLDPDRVALPARAGRSPRRMVPVRCCARCRARSRRSAGRR
jgi:AcrR family transcriptional regulator